ncbi:MAG: MscS family inner membrane protein YnaI [Verrucomicrobiota bacterium]
MDRTFQVGDKIRQGDITGVVERIGLRSTRVRTVEGYIISIPNQLITNAPVTNMGAERRRS